VVPAGDPAGGAVAGDLPEGAGAGGGRAAVTFTKWSQIRDEQIERIGREEFEAGKEQMLAEARGWRLAEIRRRGLTQAQVAERMGRRQEPGQPDRAGPGVHAGGAGPVCGGARRAAEPDG